MGVAMETRMLSIGFINEVENKEDTSDITTAPVVSEDSIQKLQQNDEAIGPLYKSRRE